MEETWNMLNAQKILDFINSRMPVGHPHLKFLYVQVEIIPDGPRPVKKIGRIWGIHKWGSTIWMINVGHMKKYNRKLDVIKRVSYRMSGEAFDAWFRFRNQGVAMCNSNEGITYQYPYNIILK